ncbi:hypothetical protein IWQ47_002967 [Aquimarina sp. EL_43]|uniref:hypothetical protein n=1 Tax=unclassified Aquimarina TaxID=2627091 RepID=UPI0018CAAE0B|nr:MULTISPECIES: hypothetical protein [unclassified Aquimarina]MBG6131713.1 hypothetical protein [Aquimarina sp. EL_35]MBG6152174.1 hypothetical protein [Aquimarina sp. EL_32]MBG6169882.1 hypothetical protein [Aquimarina sp. EL_43]
MNKEKTLALLIGLLLWSFIPFFLGHDIAITFSSYNYLGCLLFLVGIMFSLKGFSRNVFVFSPSFIAVTYINLNFLIGSIVFQRELVFDFLLEPYQKWSNYNLVMGYFNLANYAIIISFFFSSKISLSFKHKLICDLRKFSSGFLFLTGILVIIPFVFFDVNLDFIGGEGSFSDIFRTIGAIILIVNIFSFSSLRKRLLFYFILLFCFSIISWEDKRDAIFLLLPILILESTRFRIKVDFKKVFLISVSTIAVLYLILVMSITRGYGNFKANNFAEASGYVLDYINSKDFIPGFMNNLEISYTYMHSNNAVERIIKEPDLLAYGETIIKPLFIFIPRSIYKNKPRSILHQYTYAFSKEYRNKGGSWTISFQSEMFWNFSFFGIFVGGFFFYVFNIIYRQILKLINNNNIINYIPLLYFYEILLVLFRGSGIDMFLIFVIISSTFFMLLKLNLKLIHGIVRKE